MLVGTETRVGSEIAGFMRSAVGDVAAPVVGLELRVGVVGQCLNGRFWAQAVFFVSGAKVKTL